MFEKYSDIINREISKRQVKWNLTAIPSISFDDISQNLKLHIYTKIHLYDEKKAKIENWINTIITNQLKNVLRSLYLNYNKPCISCACAEGEDDCRIFGKQDEVCPLVAHWQKVKLSAYNTKLPLPIEKHEQEIHDLPQKNFDLETSAQNLHTKMELILTHEEYQIYNLLYIEHKTDEETVNALGFIKNKQTGHTIITKVKKLIILKAINLIKNNEVDIVEN